MARFAIVEDYFLRSIVLRLAIELDRRVMVSFANPVRKKEKLYSPRAIRVVDVIRGRHVGSIRRDGERPQVDRQRFGVDSNVFEVEQVKAAVRAHPGWLAHV